MDGLSLFKKKKNKYMYFFYFFISINKGPRRFWAKKTKKTKKLTYFFQISPL